MKSLVIYDNKGVIFHQIKGSYTIPDGLQYIELEIPDGKFLKYIDISNKNHKPIYEDIPKTNEEILKEENEKLKIALAELAESQNVQQLEIQAAIAELAELMAGGK